MGHVHTVWSTPYGEVHTTWAGRGECETKYWTSIWALRKLGDEYGVRIYGAYGTYVGHVASVSDGPESLVNCARSQGRVDEKRGQKRGEVVRRAPFALGPLSFSCLSVSPSLRLPTPFMCIKSQKRKENPGPGERK